MNEIKAIRTEESASEAAFHSVEAEQQVLGNILVDNSRFAIVSTALKAEHFFDPVHARIFQHIAARFAEGRTASPITAKAYLADDAGLKELGGPSYLARMAGAAMAGFAIKDYADHVIELARRRALRQALSDGLSALSGGMDAPAVVSGVQRAAHALPGGVGGDASVSFLRAVTDSVQAMNEGYQGNAPLLKTGFAALDQIVKGLAQQELMLLGGATSMGKTATAVAIAKNVAEQGKPVVYVTKGDMGAVQIAQRIISAESNVRYSEMRDAEGMDETTFRKVIEASQAVGERLPIRIVAGKNTAISDVEAEIERACAEGRFDPALIVVDYLQLLTAPGGFGREKMDAVANWAGRIPKVFNCPLLGLVQISRDIGERPDKRPTLTDIRETAQFENNADIVAFTHRPEYWLERGGPQPDKAGKITEEARAEHAIELAKARNVLELIVRKNRSGQLGIAQVGCHIATNRFWRLGQDDDQGSAF